MTPDLPQPRSPWERLSGVIGVDHASEIHITKIEHAGAITGPFDLSCLGGH
jgi:hypothetical protein